MIVIRWKKNDLSKELRKNEQWLRKKFFPISWIALLCFLWLVLPFLEALENSTSLIEAYHSAPTWLLLFLLLFPLAVLFIHYTALWLSKMGNPKYIKWDDEGIKIINRRNKKDFVPWDTVYDIAWAGDISSKEKKYPEYILLINMKYRFNSALYLNPKIGKELQKAWEDHGGEITRSYQPPGEK